MTTAEVDSQVLRIPRRRIRLFDGQPRKFFDPVKLEELATSIKEIGQREPIKVIPIDGDPEHDYVLDDGERRLKACEKAGIETMRALICTDIKPGYEQFVDSVVSNFGREPHTPLESARAIKRILDDPEFPGRGLSQHKQYLMIARMFARSYSWVAMTVRLLDELHPKVLAMLEPDVPEEQRLGLAMADFLASLKDKDIQLVIASRVASKGLKLNQARAAARQLAKQHGVQLGNPKKPSDQFRTLQRFIHRIDEDAEYVLDMSNKKLKEMLASRGKNELNALADTIDERMKQLGELSQAMRRAANGR